MKNYQWLRTCVAYAAIVIGIVSCFGPTPTRTPAPVPTPRLIVISTPATPARLLETPTPRPGTVKVNLDELAPPGVARDQLILNCGNCHSFACALRGQRTDAHWDLVRQFHTYSRWIVLEENRLDLIFNYLKANFNENDPVPDFPPALADQGCTTPAIR